MTCKPLNPENVLIVDTRGDPEKHKKTKAHKYTYESSEVFADGRGKDPYASILLHIVWKCTICDRVVTQLMKADAPRKCSEFIEVEVESTT